MVAARAPSWTIGTARLARVRVLRVARGPTTVHFPCSVRCVPMAARNLHLVSSSKAADTRPLLAPSAGPVAAAAAAAAAPEWQLLRLDDELSVRVPRTPGSL